MIDNQSVTANFTPCYTLSINTNPPDSGGISANPAPNCNGGSQYTSGTLVQLTANPVTGKAFTNWSGDGSGTANPLSVTVEANKSVTANFDTGLLHTYQEFAKPAGSGTISANPAPNCNSGKQYTYNTVVQLTTTPISGYGFLNWSGDASGSANPVLDDHEQQPIGYRQPYPLLHPDDGCKPGRRRNISANPAANCNNGTQ